MGDSVDIVVSQTGADEAAASFAALSTSADQAAQSVDATNQAIGGVQSAASAAASPLQAVADAAQGSAQAMDQNYKMVYNASTGFYDIVTAAQQARIALEEAGTSAANSGAEFQQAAEAMNTHAKGADAVAVSTVHAKEGTEAFSEATNLLKEALQALGLIFTAEKIIELTEAFQKTEIQMRSVSASTKELEENTRALYEISQLTGSSYAANVNSFQKLATETSALNLSQKDLLDVIRNVDAVVQEAGGTSAQAAAAVNLFGRAIATGTVQGRQFRTIMYDFPQIGQLIANGLNTSTQALVSMSTKSATTSKQFVDAFNKAAGAANVAGKEIELTLGGALTVLGNAILEYVGQTDHANGMTQLLSNTIACAARNFATIAASIEVAITLWASYYVTLVAIPGAINLITTSVRLLTAAVAANPLGFLLVALVATIALVYQFGNSVKLTSDGSITMLGALIGVYNYLKAKLTEIVTYMVVNWGPTFTQIGAIAKAAIAPLLATLQGVLYLLSFISPAAAAAYAALTASTDTATASTGTLKQAMIDATTELNKTKDSATQLGSALGDGKSSIAESANKAAASMKALNDTMTQNGRVNADAIPPFTNLVDAHNKLVEASKKAAEQMKAYYAEVDKAAAETEKLALTTRNAMGDMITATDEWARRSGEDFNAVANAADKMANSVSSAQGASNAASSGGGSGGGGDGQKSSGAILGNFGDTMNQVLQTGILQPGSNWEELISHAENIQGATGQQVVATLRADAHAAGAPGFATGGDFLVGGSGGTDSQLVQFYATPGEQVQIKTPAQQQGSGGQAKSITVNMTIQTPDANSFRRSQAQTLLQLRGKLNGAMSGMV